MTGGVSNSNRGHTVRVHEVTNNSAAKRVFKESSVEA
jgi:hypothetical protein